MTFIERFMDNAVKYANHPILADDTNPKGLTLEKVDILSGKVYAWLQNKGIGKEDFVMLCLPRGVQPLIALLGVLKNGSAFVLVEDNYAPERIAYIRNDCGCKLVIDAQAWNEIQHLESKSGFEKTEPHDAAFAIYTSGTTGNPKGVIHEYGNLDRMIDSITMTTCEPLASAEDRFALVAPLNFIASLLIVIYGFTFRVFIYVVSYKTIKNPLLTGMFVMMNSITGMFLTPSHIRKLGKNIPGLKFCIIGSEPANNVYLEGLLIHNFYLMSESGFAVSHFLIDQLYEETPVGDSEFNHQIYLLDENGQEVAEGEKGEICFENDYVRGYLNLPEQTAEAFKDSDDGKGRLYHTGDLARRDEKGRLIICGRLNDMVKVNGNRVEPGEIENVAKKVLHIDWTAARIFDDGNRVFIALYYKDHILIDSDRIRKELELYLPYYMIPSFFIHVDEIPLRPNGKMDRKALPKPDFESYRKAYTAPRDETEKALCDAFSKVLNMGQVGIHDDFYELGGDSLASMAVIESSNLPGLQATQIFRGHTPEKIAEIYKEESAGLENIDMEKANQKALSHPQFLTPEQVYMLDYQLYTPMSTMYNLFEMMKFDLEQVDMKKLSSAVKTAVFNHPALLTVLFCNEDGEFMQKYSPEIWQDIPVEKVTEAELDKIKDTLVRPFKILNSPLFRCRLFETETAGYLFFDVHHTLFDGTSSKVFFGDLLEAYCEQPLEPDYYYFHLQKKEKQMHSTFYQESKDYFDKKYSTDTINWQGFPTIDHETRENVSNEIILPLPIDSEKYTRLLKLNSLSPNAFFVTANMLATAFYNRHKDIMMSWVYNGRVEMNEMSTVGLMIKDLPVAVRLKKELKLSDLFADVVEQINKGIEHSCYAAVDINSRIVEDDTVCVLYQDDLREIGEMPGLLGNVDIEHNQAASQNILDVEILNTPEGIEILLDYAASRYDESSIEKYGRILSAMAVCMVNHADDTDITVKNIMTEVFSDLGMGGFFSRLFSFGWLS